MKYPVLILFMTVLVPAFALFILLRVVQSALEIFLLREQDMNNKHKPD